MDLPALNSPEVLAVAATPGQEHYVDDLLRKKLSGCCEIFSFASSGGVLSPAVEQRKLAKRSTLIELVEYVCSDSHRRAMFFSDRDMSEEVAAGTMTQEVATAQIAAAGGMREGHLPEFIRMVECNLFCPAHTQAENGRSSVRDSHQDVASVGGSFTTGHNDEGPPPDRRLNLTAAGADGSPSSSSPSSSTSSSSHEQSPSSSSPLALARLSRKQHHRQQKNRTKKKVDEEEVLNAAWSHVQIVYEFMVRFAFAEEVDAASARTVIGRTFMHGLFQCFRSLDRRERGYIKTICHQLYTRFQSLRTFMRRSMEYMLLECNASTCVDLLEIFASIIAGFKSPIRSDHVLILERVLMPMHKRSDDLEHLYAPLVDCIKAFVERDASVIRFVIKGLVQAWPHAARNQCGVLLLDELSWVIQMTPPNDFRGLVSQIFPLVAASASSDHYQVAENALLLWRSEYFVSLVAQNRHEVLPIMYQPLSRGGLQHWHPQVQTLAKHVLKLFASMDMALFRSISEGKSEGVLETAGGNNL